MAHILPSGAWINFNCNGDVDSWRKGLSGAMPGMPKFSLLRYAALVCRVDHGTGTPIVRYHTMRSHPLYMGARQNASKLSRSC